MSTEVPIGVMPAENTNPAWRETTAPARPTLRQEKAGFDLHHCCAGRWTLSLFNTYTANAVGGRLSNSNLAVHGAGPAMATAARPDHGGDPRPLCFSLLVARGLVCSRVRDGAEETEMKEISCERSRQAVREWFCRSKAILHY